MILEKTTIQKAFCDACGAKLSHWKGETPESVDHAKLVNRCVWGSKLSTLDSLDLCEACYIKVLRVLGQAAESSDVPAGVFVHLESRLLDTDEAYDPEKHMGRYIYWLPVWRCSHCAWREEGRGYSVPAAHTH